MKKRESNGETKLHNVKFYNILPRAITCMAFNQEYCKLGVVRDDGSIEIWNMLNAPFLEKTIAGGVCRSVESIAWCEKRLFSVGLLGDGLVEWNLKTLEKERNLLLTGNAAFCLDVNKQNSLIAVGTEEGYLNIFDVTDDELEFMKILDKQEGKIICCKFDHSGNYLVTGSLDAVRIWNIENGHAIHKMSTGRSESRSETIVWCLEVLKDFTILSGDSRGRVTVWDGNLGNQIDSMQASKADVLCLAVSSDESSFYCSGVEQILRRYTKITTNKDQWVRSFKRSNIHTHDVRAMVCLKENTLISGGVDGFLAISEKELKTFERHTPLLQRPFIFLAEESRLTLFKYTNYLEVWKLGIPTDNFIKKSDSDKDGSECSENSTNFLLQQQPEKLLEVRAKDDETVLCCNISRNGKFIVYSTTNHIRLFNFETETSGKPVLFQIKDVPEEFKPCQQAIFSKDSRNLFLVNKNGNCYTFQISENELILQQTFEIAKYLKDYVHLVTISDDSQYLVFAALCNNICVWKFDGSEWRFYKNLPKYKFPVTSLAMRDDSTMLVAAFSNQKLFEYNLEDWEFKFSTQLPATNKLSNHAIVNLCMDPRNQDVIVFQRDNKIFVLNKNPHAQNSQEHISKKKKKKLQQEKVQTSSPSEESFSLKVVKTFKSHLLHLEWMGEDQLVAVEVSPLTLLEQLPAPMRQKKFGVS